MTEEKSIDNEWIPPHGLAKGYPWNGIVTQSEELTKHESAETLLRIAETQIADMLIERPFIPEDFGFDAIVKPESVQDVPVTIYMSKYDNSVVMYREGEGWVIQKKRDGTNIIIELQVKFECQRIAYAFFWAMSIQVEDKA